MAYSANEIAHFVVDYAMRENRPVTNLKLQKILYFLWIEFYRARTEYLYDNQICAWPLGPVVPDVYDEFCVYGGFEIRKNYPDISTELHEEVIDVLKSAIGFYLTKSARELVDFSHHKDAPWDMIYQNGAGYRRTIPFSLIVEKGELPC